MQKKILIGEDNYFLSYVLVQLIEKTGGKVIAVCRTGKDILDQILITKPDLIIMDIFLNGSMNGIEVMNEIRKKSMTPVLFVSSQSRSVVENHLVTIDNAFFLSKPILYGELKKMIRKILGE